MSTTNIIEEVMKRLPEREKQIREALAVQTAGLQYGTKRPSPELFVQAFEARVQADVAKFGAPLFILALQATKDGKPMVEGGIALLKQYVETKERLTQEALYGRPE